MNCMRTFLRFHLCFLFGLLISGQLLTQAQDEPPPNHNPPFERKPNEPAQYGTVAAQVTTGTRYRKLSIDGTPLREEKPEEEPDTDAAPEETFIDAFNLRLDHATSDIFVPLVGGDLNLEVRRTLVPAVHHTGDPRPLVHRRDQPFGPGWTTSLAPTLEITAKTLPPGGDNTWEPDYVHVTDENGATYRFLTVFKDGEIAYVGVPASGNSKEDYTCTLERDENTFTFRKRFGTEITYELIPELEQIFPLDGEDTNNGIIHYYYGRATQVESLKGDYLIYSYDAPDYLIPDEITANGHSSLDITIQHDGYRISQVTDPEGNTYQYSYRTVAAAGDVRVLDTVSGPEGHQVDYDMSFYEEIDETPFVIQEGGDPPDQEYFHHFDLTKITDARNNAYSFTWLRNDIFTGLHSLAGLYRISGKPRLLETVSLPDGGFVSCVDESDVSMEFVEGVLTVAAAHKTKITDVAGTELQFVFSDFVLSPQDQFAQYLDPLDAARYPQYLATYTKMTVSYEGHDEVFEYELNAGLALKSATDMHGNTTLWEYTDPWSVEVLLGVVPIQISGFYPQPTVENPPGDGAKAFQYHSSTRILKQVVDEEGVRTEMDIDDRGLVTKRKVIDPTHGVIEEIDYDYNSSHPAFLTKKTTKALSSQPWAKDHEIKYFPDSLDRVQSATVDPGGLNLKTDFSYDTNGNKLSETSPEGRQTNFDYDGRNRLWKVTYDDNTTKTFEYDDAGNKVEEINERNVKTSFQFDERNRRKESTIHMDLGPNIVTKRKYDARGLVEEETDPRNHTTHYDYDALGRLEECQKPGLDSVTYSYTGANCGSYIFGGSFQPTKVTDEDHYDTTTQYNVRGWATEATRQVGGLVGDAKTVNTYDDAGRLVASRDPLLRTTHYEVDGLGRVTRTDYPDQTHTTTEYLGTGQAWKVTDERGHVTETHFDAAGRPVTQVLPLVDALIPNSDPTVVDTFSDHPVIETTYDDDGNVDYTIDALGNRTDYTYDARNRKLTETLPPYTDYWTGVTHRPIIEYAYDDAGNLTQTTSPGGNITITQYDNANRPYQVTQPDPGLWNGWPKDHTSQDPPPIIPSAEGTPVTLTVYDPNGNVLTVTDAEGNTTTNVYDARNRLLKTTDAENIEVEYRYDGRGNRTKVIDGKNQTNEFEYDGLGRNTKTIDPALNEVVFEYDAMRKVARIDAANRRTEYLYDARDRLLDVVYIGDPDENRTYTYDLSGNLLSVTEPGKPNGIADVAYTYDALNRVLTETSNNRTHTYHYDLGGNRLRTEYGGTGRIILSEYDDHNRLSKMVENGRTTFYRYDCEGNIVAKTLPGSQTVATKFDGLGRRKVISGPGYQFDYAYDMVGNTKRIEEAYSNGLQNRIVDLVYDDIYRLEKETTQVPAVQQTTVTDYTYDDANNRSEKSVNGLAVSYSYNELNQLTGSSDGVYYSYDLHGNRTQRSNGDQIVKYTYDRENRLVSVEELVPDSTLYEGYLQIPWSLSGWPEPSYPVHEDWNLEYVDLSTHYGGYSWKVGDLVHIETSSVSEIEGEYLLENPETGWYILTGTHYRFRLLGGQRTSEVEGPVTFSITSRNVYEYVYDYRTRRVRRSENAAAADASISTQFDEEFGSITDVVFSGGTSIAEYVDGAEKVEFVRGSDWGGGVGGILYSLRDDSPSLTHYNNRGDVIAKTDLAGSTTYAAAYEAFSTRPIEIGNTEDRQRGNTKEEDPTGFLNEGFRYRDLETGSFITRDPLGFVDGPNMYTYVRQNPWTMFDPHGLEGELAYTLKQTFGPMLDAVSNVGAGAMYTVTRSGDYAHHFLNGGGIGQTPALSEASSSIVFDGFEKRGWYSSNEGLNRPIKMGMEIGAGFVAGGPRGKGNAASGNKAGSATGASQATGTGITARSISERNVTIGKIFDGADPDSMISISTGTVDELAEGIYADSSFVRLGDVSDLTIDQYKTTVVGPAAAGSSTEANMFVRVGSDATKFKKVDDFNLAGVDEFRNADAVIPEELVEVPAVKKASREPLK